MNPFERLRAWSSAHEVVLNVYRATRTWPSDEKYGLTAQARRSAFSIAANISEGSAKRGRREFRRFLDIAIGSSAELCYILRLAHDLGFLTDAAWKELEAQRSVAGKQIWRLYLSMAETEK